MARTRTRQPEPPKGFVASAVSLPAPLRADAGKPQPWQNEAWTYYNTVPELRYLSNWIGNAMSRATLHGARRVGNSLEVQDNGPAFDAMEALYGGPQNHPALLKGVGIHETVAGEVYVVVRGDDKWATLASGKVTQQGEGDKAELYADFGDGETRVHLDKGRDLAIRIWTPHPTNSRKADAPTRSNINTLKQIVGYDAHITAQLSSRLTGSGILFLPAGIEFAATENAGDGSQADVFMKTIAETMTAAKQNPAGPEGTTPIVVMVPPEALENIQHMTFWSELDDSVIEMRASAIERFAIGMDAPPSVLMGTGDENHWNAWLSEEAAIKVHLEPRLSASCAALTEQYLRPSLTGIRGVNPDEYFVIADTSEIRVRPNRSEQALEMWDRGLLGDVPVLRETGFKPEDRLAGEEYIRWLYQRQAHGAATPEMAADAMNRLGAPITLIDPDADPQEQPDHLRSDTEVERDARSGGAPKLEVVQSSGGLQVNETPLFAACEMLVFRALERAGNKLRNKHPRTDTQAMAAHEVYLTLAGDENELLAGTWDYAAESLTRYTTDADAVTQVLDFYVRGLLSQKRPHNAQTLSTLLASSHLEALAN